MRHWKLTIFILITLALVVAACSSPTAAPAPVELTAEPATATSAPAEYATSAVTPSVTVSDQEISDGAVTVAEVVSDGPGWLVIHAQYYGKPGTILGYSPVADGVNTDVTVKINVDSTTDVLYAMLHTDAGVMGKFEFPNGEDVPVSVDGKIVTPAFNVTMPAKAMAETVTVMLGGTDELGPFLVDAKGMTLYTFGKDGENTSACYGQCATAWPPLLVTSGQTPTLAADIPGKLDAFSRDDGGMQVTYNGAPLYYFVQDKKPGDAKGEGLQGLWYVATPSGETQPEKAMPTPSVTVSDQEISDGTVTVSEVVSNGPGWLVIHAQADGKPGPILGYSPVADGVNTDVKVDINVDSATDVLYAMLHTDAGVMGKFEFPGGEDVPVSVDGKVVTPAFNVTLPAQEAMAETATVMLGGTDELGPFLVDAKGMTLYTFGKDGENTSACYGQCAKAWPPLFVASGETPTLAADIPGELGVFSRDDGGMQVTYNGTPLYYFVQDKKPGDAKGDGLQGLWYVATPSGD